MVEQASRSKPSMWTTLAFVSLALVLVSPGSWRSSVVLPVVAAASSATSGLFPRDVQNLNDAFIIKPRATAQTALNNGLTDVVEWDNFSLIVKGQRVFLYSGEFHTFRLPVPSLWLDILQKVKASGLNGISVYTHWGLINPAPGVVDFDGFRALQPLFDAAKEAGIWIVMRPGPYINGETTAGGIAHWVTTEVAGTLRTNAADFTAAWQNYITGIAKAIEPNQITNGGPVIAVQIDNESQGGSAVQAYFQLLEQAYRDNGIVVPLTYNDPGERKNFVNGTGHVDIYGLDSYPQGFDCSHPTRWSAVPTNWHDYHEGTNPSQPFYFPEFQGGSFDAWGPNAPGYPQCQILTGPDFEDVFYKSLWAANVKMLSFYMIFGGTSWGGLPFPGVYTSYDYGSSISENRVLSSKHPELKRQGFFLRSSPDFYKTNWIGNSSTSAVTVSNSAAFVVLLSNPDTGTNFYIARQSDSTSTAVTNFTLNATTSQGDLTLPQVVSTITLNGRQSKVIVTDYKFGSSKALYSTANIMFAGQIGNRDVLFLFGDSTVEHEATISLTGTSSAKPNPQVQLSNSTGHHGTVVAIRSGAQGLITIWDSATQLVLFADTTTAGTFSAPVIPSTATSGDAATFKNYWQFGSNSTVLVGGPYLVRNATISGSKLALTGDLNTTSNTPLTVIAPSQVRSITWNGRTVSLDSDAGSSVTTIGGLVGSLTPRVTSSSVKLPSLTNWKFADSVPEIQSNFSDDGWTIANHTTTNSPFPMNYGDGRILYGCDYGFCEGVVLWRGHFNATGQEKFVNLSINGGEAFAASAWINNVFLSTSFGNSSNNANNIAETDQQFTFPSGSLIAGKDNVITIVQDNMGRDETGSSTNNKSKSPRGVRGFALNGTNFSTWKVQGKVGGYKNFPDKTRGVLNEGGLFGERQGWHLPGFDTSSWKSRALTSGLPNSAAGVGFFVTTFNLNIPSGTDVPISFNFADSSSNQPYRALLFVNGWMMGKRVANLGPQTKFPVHQGILNYKARNTVAVALWAMEPNTTISPNLVLEIDGVIEGGVGGILSNNPTWTERSVS